MNSFANSEICSRMRKVFTVAWSAELGVALAAAAPKEGYQMSLVGKDCQAVIAAVNAGIDAHLEACFLPERGDRYNFTATEGQLSAGRLECAVSPESLAALVRRLLEAGDPDADSLAASICQTLGIELV